MRSYVAILLCVACGRVSFGYDAGAEPDGSVDAGPCADAGEVDAGPVDAGFMCDPGSSLCMGTVWVCTITGRDAVLFDRCVRSYPDPDGGQRTRQGYCALESCDAGVEFSTGHEGIVCCVP